MDVSSHYHAPFGAYEKDKAFHDLLQLMQSERPPLVLVGAGASVGSGYPSWPALLERLRERALRDNKSDWRRSIEDMSDAPWTAELFANRLEPGGLASLIRHTFRSQAMLAEPHLTLGRMKFPHYLTTNYDPSIEEALERAGRTFRRIVWPHSDKAGTNQAEDLSEFLIALSDRKSPCSVVYLHGRYDSPEDEIVLTESDYVARYISSDDARRKLMAIFLTHPVLFVGFSMSDPDLANLMREVTARLRTKTPCHYALMSYKTESDREAIRARMEGKFGVRPVFFSRTPLDEGADAYQNLLLLLDALHQADAEGERPHKLASPQESAPVPRFDPDDPNKGRFGGNSTANGRTLTATRTGGSQKDQSLRLRLTVEPLPNAPPLEGQVIFHLHPTFSDDIVTRTIRAGRATHSCAAWGAFTVGAIADGGRTRLELDLAQESSLPLWFRRN